MVADFQQYKRQIQRDLLPCNIEAEQAVLGGIILDASAFPRVKDMLEPKHFYFSNYQLLYKRIQELSSQKGVTDFLSLKSYLEDKKELDKIGGLGTLLFLNDSVVTTANVDLHASLIVQKWLQRETIAIANELISFATEYQLEDFKDWYEEQDIKQKGLLDRPSLYLGIVEKQLHRLTRSRYRESLDKDTETVKYYQLIERIKEIENTYEDIGVKRYKMMGLSKEYKISEKQLESLYMASLISDQNEPIQTLASLREKYGDDVNEWFIHGMIPKGSVTLLHALGGVGKTRLAYDMCYSMATGTPWGSEFPVTSPTRKCLLVQTDESQGDMIRTLNGRGFTDDMEVFAKTKWTFDNIAALRREIIENGIEVVVIDSLTSVNRNAIVSENDTEYARPILQLKDMAQELGVSIIMIHHSNSEGKSRGTKAIHNSVSQVLSLRFPSEGSETSCEQRLLVIDKSRFRRPTKYRLSFVFDEETYQWSWLCEGEDKDFSDEDTIKHKIVKFFESNRNVMLSAHDIADNLKLAYNSVRKALFQLSELDHLIGRKKKGRSWLHFLRWQSDRTDPNDPSDLEGGDHKEPSHDKGFKLSDPPIVKNDQTKSEEPTKITDQKITQEKETSETLTKEYHQPDHLIDPSNDHSFNSDNSLDHQRPIEYLGSDIKYLGTDPDISIRFKYCQSIEFLGVDNNGMVTLKLKNSNGKKYSELIVPSTDLA